MPPASSFAAGLASQGFKPVFAVYSTFLQRAFDQLLHDVALQNLHVVFAIDRAGLVGEDGPTHHGAFDLSYLHTVPGLVIMAPADEQELRDMLYTALYDLKSPVAIRYPRGNGTGITLRKKFTSLSIGKAQIVRKGHGLAILSIGNMTGKALEVASVLEKDGIDATVVNMRFLKPLDTELIEELASQSTHFAVLEENSIIGGLGSAVIDYLTTNGLNRFVLKIALPDAFVTHGHINDLYQHIGFDTPTMTEKIKRFYMATQR